MKPVLEERKLKIERSDAKVIHAVLQRVWGESFTLSYVCRVLKGERHNERIVQMAQRYYQEKKKMLNRLDSWANENSNTPGLM